MRSTRSRLVIGIVIAAAVGLLALIVGASATLAPPLGLAASAAWFGGTRGAARSGHASGSGAPARIDAYTLSEPWRHYVLSGQNAKSRFVRVVASTSPGPIRDRLAELGHRLERGIEECWQVAHRGDRIDAAITQLNPGDAARRLATTRAEVAGGTPTPAQAATIHSLEAQVAATTRLQSVSADTRSRLDLLDTRLDELVARAAEVSVGAADTTTLSGEVDELVNDLESLRLALDEVNRAAEDSADTFAPSNADAPQFAPEVLPTEAAAGATQPTPDPPLGDPTSREQPHGGAQPG